VECGVRLSSYALRYSHTRRARTVCIVDVSAQRNTRGDGQAYLDRDKESRPETWVALLARGG
jgi:hypothetical protein